MTKMDDELLNFAIEQRQFADQHPGTGADVLWLTAGSFLEDWDRRDYYVRLVAILARHVSQETMSLAVAQALPSHGVKRGED
jgi:hypothetical protein